MKTPAATEITTSARQRNFSGNLLDSLNDSANHNELLLAALVRIAEALEKQNEILTEQTQALEGIANRIEDAGRCL